MKLIHGDCLEELKNIQSGSVDMVLADLPYGTTACKWDTIIPFEPLWKELHRVGKANCAFVMFGSQPFTASLGFSNIRNLKYSWVWEKSRPTMFLQAKKQPLKGFEDILIFYSKPPTYKPQGLTSVEWSMKNTGTKKRGYTKANGDVTAVHSGIRGSKRAGDHYTQTATGYPRGILKFAQESIYDHPTQKPVALLEYLIKTYTLEGQTVLDPTMGSGSTGVACKNLGRNFIGIERDQNYFEIAEKRIAAVNAVC